MLLMPLVLQVSCLARCPKGLISGAIIPLLVMLLRRSIPVAPKLTGLHMTPRQSISRMSGLLVMFLAWVLLAMDRLVQPGPLCRLLFFQRETGKSLTPAGLFF